MSVISIPGLWIPRPRRFAPIMPQRRSARLPWWKRLNPLYALSGEHGLDASGNLMLNTSGEVAVDCGAKVCNNCPDSTPSQYTVTFTGVTICACSLVGPSGPYIAVTGTIDGTYTLTQDSLIACIWWCNYSGLTYTERGSAGCTGTTGRTSTTTYIELSRYSGTFRLSAMGVFPSPSYPRIYIQNPITASTCIGSFSSSNYYTVCEVSPDYAQAYGGGATITNV